MLGCCLRLGRFVGHPSPLCRRSGPRLLAAYSYTVRGGAQVQLETLCVLRGWSPIFDTMYVEI